MKKIAYLLKMFPRFAETFILNEILELERQGLNLHIYSLKHPNESFRQGKLNLVHSKITYVPEPISITPVLWIRNLSSMIPIIKENLRLFARDPNRYLLAWHACCKFHDKRVRKRFLAAGYIAQSLLKEGIDHLHAHFANDPATVAHLVHLLSGIPYSFTAHAKDIYLSPKEDLQHKIHLARFVITCTKYNQKYLQEIATNGTPVYTIYHGLDEQMFVSQPFEGFKPSKGSSPLILSVGRLVEKKGFDTLIKACGLLRDWQVSFRCEIVGEGPQAKYLKGIIAQLQLNEKIEILPFLPQERLVTKYLQATVFTLPCQITKNGDRDGIPNVLLEAMALGRLVVSTHVSGISELIHHNKNGLLVPPRDPYALAQTLRQVLMNSDQYQYLGKYARHTVKQFFNLQSNVFRLKKLLEECPS